ncbi:MAG: MFS transporter [Pseudomonadota bacterium]
MTISTPPSARSAERSGFAEALGLFFLNGFLFGTWAARIPDVKLRFDLSEAAMGGLLLTLGIGAVVAFLLLGRSVDRIGAARFSAWSAVAMALVLPLIALSDTVLALGAALIAFGMIGGALDMAMNVYGAEVEARRAAPSMSRMHGMWSVGFGCGSGALILAQGAGLGMLEQFAGVAALMLLVALACMSRMVPSTTGQDTGGRIFVMPRGAVLGLCLIIAIAFAGEGAVLDWTGIHIVEGLSGTLGEGATALAIFSIVMVVLRLTGDYVVARIGARRVVIASGTFILAGGALMFWSDSTLGVYAAMVLFATGFAPLAPTAFSAAGRSRDMSLGRAMAALSLFGYGSLLFGPVAMGMIAEVTSLPMAFLGLGVLALICLARLGRRQNL